MTEPTFSTKTTTTTKLEAATTTFTTKRNLSENSSYQRNNSERTAVNGSGDIACDDTDFLCNKQQERGKQKMWQNELYINASSSAAQPEERKTQSKLQGYGSARKGQYISDIVDVVLRICLVSIFFKLETTQPFRRKIHLEEMWLYKNPRTADIVTPAALFFVAIFGPFLTTILFYLVTRDKRDFRAASWVWTLALCLNGIATSMLKLTVGRPRPDFYYRCFPDGIMLLHNATDLLATQTGNGILNCTGPARDIIEGYKSFPSGHSSFGFVGFGFISFYVAGKLHAFNRRGRGESWRLVFALAPLLVAMLVAVSRTCDYHHHWQDVLVGSIIGFFATYLCYRQYYPSLFSPHCHQAFKRYSASDEVSFENETTQHHGSHNCNYKRLTNIEAETDCDANDNDALDGIYAEFVHEADRENDFNANTTPKEECQPLICSNGDCKEDSKWI